MNAPGAAAVSGGDAEPIDTPDGLLAIVVGGSTERWDEALAAAEPVLESVRIGAD